MPTLSHFCFWVFIVISVSATSPEHENIALSDSDIGKLSCLFFREDCPDHLTDLAAADRIFWRVRIILFRNILLWGIIIIKLSKKSQPLFYFSVNMLIYSGSSSKRQRTEVKFCQSRDLYGITVSRYIQVILFVLSITGFENSLSAYYRRF